MAFEACLGVGRPPAWAEGLVLLAGLLLLLRRRGAADASCDAASSTAPSAAEPPEDICIETGRTARAFAALCAVGPGQLSGRHRLEGKGYLLVRVPQPLRSIAELRATPAFRLLIAGTAIAHPALARWVTFWAEASDLRAERALATDALRRGRSRSAATLRELLLPPRDALDAERAALPHLVLQIELPAGPTLAAWLRVHRLSATDALLLFVRLLDALALLHTHGLAHGDFGSHAVVLGEEPKIVGHGLRALGGASVAPGADVRALGLLLLQLIANTRAGDNLDVDVPEMTLAAQMIWRDVGCAPNLEEVRCSPHLAAWRQSVFGLPSLSL